MALLVDAGALYAQADADEPQHEAVAKMLRHEREVLVTTELVVAEADYLILTRLGVDVELAFLEDLAEGTYRVECLTVDELRTARPNIAICASAWPTRHLWCWLKDTARAAFSPLTCGHFAP